MFAPSVKAWVKLCFLSRHGSTLVSWVQPLFSSLSIACSLRTSVEPFRPALSLGHLPSSDGRSFRPAVLLSLLNDPFTHYSVAQPPIGRGRLFSHPQFSYTRLSFTILQNTLTHSCICQMSALHFCFCTYTFFFTQFFVPALSTRQPFNLHHPSVKPTRK